MAFDFLKRFVSTPKPQAEVAPGERRHAPRVRAPAGSKVLVVDDSPTIRAVLGKMLGQDGYTVLKAPDGETAVTIARGELPDLIFLDIVLPGMSGFEVLRTLRRDPHTKATPIVMISGNMQATEQFYVQRFGADDFMKKPFGRAEVFERIRALVEAGRLPERAPEAEPEPVVPAGISAEEWAAIPDVAMPDAQTGDAVAQSLRVDETTEKA
ncbi:MAG TPA: response regulator [Rhodanobacteraceae bacterium]|nr:response regulator [Rhodanobacteraceae bacterium]